jgi:hypothetical protein
VRCTLTIPPLDNNDSHVEWIQTTSTGTIRVTWTMRFNQRNNIQLIVYSIFPVDEIASERDNTVTITLTTPSVEPGYYAVLFRNRGNDLPLTTTATLEFMGTSCPT